MINLAVALISMKCINYAVEVYMCMISLFSSYVAIILFTAKLFTKY